MNRGSLSSCFYSNGGSIPESSPRAHKRSHSDRVELGFDSSDSDEGMGGPPGGYTMMGAMDLSEEGASRDGPRPGKKTKGRVKIKMEFIENKLRRYTTFSKRKTGIMKKAYELSTLTGTQVMLLVASETGHVYTFATRKLQPMITSESGKALIQTCLNSPDCSSYMPGPEAAVPRHETSSEYESPDSRLSLDQRMNPSGFEEPDLGYAACDEHELDEEEEFHFDDHGNTVQQQEQHPPFYKAQNISHQPGSQLSSTISLSPAPSQAHRNNSSLAGVSHVIHYSEATEQRPQGSSTKRAEVGNQALVQGLRESHSMLYETTSCTDDLTDSLGRSQGPINLARSRPDNIETKSSENSGAGLINATSVYQSTAITSEHQSSVQLSFNSSLIPATGQPLSKLSGMSGSPGALVYQTPQGLIYATPSISSLAEGGCVLRLPRDSTKPQAKDARAPQQQSEVQPPFITIPASLAANAQLIQAILAQQHIQFQQQHQQSAEEMTTNDVTPTDLRFKVENKTDTN